jgi:hypothetical protein
MDRRPVGEPHAIGTAGHLVASELADERRLAYAAPAHDRNQAAAECRVCDHASSTDRPMRPVSGAGTLVTIAADGPACVADQRWH